MASEGKNVKTPPQTPPPAAGASGGLLRHSPGPTGATESSASAPASASANTLRDRLVLLLVSGMSTESAEGYCVRHGGMDLDTARRTVAEARQRITVAADYTRDEQLGKAVMRLDDLYAKSIAGQDARTALQAQRELNRLLGLYWADGTAAQTADSDAQEALRRLELISGYLIPLRLTDERYPVEEHARIASDIIRTHKLAGV